MSARENDLLWRIADTVDQVGSRLDGLATMFSSRELDAACQVIGARLCQFGPIEPREDQSVYLVTGLGPSGGHTRVLRDQIMADPAPSKTVLISQVLDSAHQPGFERVFEGLDITFLSAPPGPDLVSKIGWVQQHLAEIRPGTVTMAIHGFDVVHTAAVQPSLCGKLFYIHNVDHTLALGAHLPHACHLDFHAKGHWQCQVVDGVPDAHLIPLVADDLGSRVGRPFLSRGHLTTASSGGSEKFSLERFGAQAQYRYEYAEGIATVLAASRGTHLHFGRLPAETIGRIYAQLDLLGLPRDRFQTWDYVPSVWTALLEYAADVYVGSFPLGGGRATVEALGAGLPLVIHSNYWSNFLSVECEVYPGAMIWRNFHDLRQHISALTPEILAEHSAHARAYYDRYHHPTRLREALARIRAGGLSPAIRPAYTPDLVSRYFDQHPELTD